MSTNTSPNSASNVAARFDSFLAKLRLTKAQKDDGTTKHSGVVDCLNRWYYDTASTTANRRLVGSWGKGTEIRPPRDIDVLFTLPWSVYERFKYRSGNVQSQLLQEVKEVLGRTYADTALRGDGQVVVVDFVSYGVEVVPAFEMTNGKYWICDTHGGGRYKDIFPGAELNHLQSSDAECAGNTRNLVRMMKCWQSYCNVPLKSFWLELLAVEFLAGWEHRKGSTVYYDWMVRDFFRHIYETKRNRHLVVPGGGFEFIALGDSWASRTESAWRRAAKACDYEAANQPYSAGDEWQKIFGTDIPVG